MFFFYTYVMFLFTATPEAVEAKRLNEAFTNKKVGEITEIEVLTKEDNEDQTPRRQLAENLLKSADDMCYGLNGDSRTIMAGKLEAGTAGNEDCTKLPAEQGAWEYIQLAPTMAVLAKATNTYIATPTGNSQRIQQAGATNVAPTAQLMVSPSLASLQDGKAFAANVGALFGSYYGFTAAGAPIARGGVGATDADGPFGFLGFQAAIAVEDVEYKTSTFAATVVNPTGNNKEKAMNACVLPLTSEKKCPDPKIAEQGSLKYSFYGYFGGNKWEEVVATYAQLIARNSFDVTKMAPAAAQDKIMICYDVEDVEDIDVTKCQKISEVPTAGKAFTKTLFVRGATDESGVKVDFSKNVNYGQIRKGTGAAPLAMTGPELSNMETFNGDASALTENSQAVTFALFRDAADNKLYIDIQIPLTGKPLAKNGGYFIYDPTVSGAAEKSVVTALFMSFMVSLWAMM